MEKTTKAEQLYRTMEMVARDGYEHFKHWDWTCKYHWGEKVTTRTIKDVQRILKSKEKLLISDFDLGIITRESYDKKVDIHQQVQKFINERMKIIKEMYSMQR
jgi:hypothetical protein